MSGTEWSVMFQELIYGNGAIFGLALIALIGVVAIAKIRASGIIFILVSGLMCISVISSNTTDLGVMTGVGYAVLIPLFLIMMLAKGKGGVF